MPLTMEMMAVFGLCLCFTFGMFIQVLHRRDDGPFSSSTQEGVNYPLMASYKLKYVVPLLVCKTIDMRSLG